MADHMRIFDELISAILQDTSTNHSYIEIFPICNVGMSLQALFLCRVILGLRKVFYPNTDFKIGIIGCGNVGSLMLRTLTDFSGIKPFRVMVSTRRPETLHAFQKDGVYICNDNQRVCI